MTEFQAENGIVNKKKGTPRCNPLLANPTSNGEVIIINSNEYQEDAEVKYEIGKNIISDSATVSSKKLSSASPPNQRSQTENYSAWQMSSMKRSKNPSLKSGSSLAYDEERKEKNKWGAKRKKRNYESIVKTRATKGEYNTGRWTRKEHFKFLEALKLFGKEWQKVQQHVNTRTSTQARSHAQKFFVKLEKHMTLDEFLERLDIEQLKIDLRIGDGGDSTEYDEDQLLIMMNNHRKVGSVMNIALPTQVYSSMSSPIQKVKTIKYPSASIIDVDQDDIAWEEGENANSKRSCIQRKAKTNHAFFSNNYSSDHISYKENFKRRKTGQNEEVIIKSDWDTKICINNYALQQYNDDHKEEQEIEELRQFEEEIQANSDIDEISDNPREMIKDIHNREYSYYHNSVLSHHHESLDDIINE